MAKATLLLADDDQYYRQGTRSLLEGVGYRVLEAADPLAARRYFETDHTIDLAILDVHLKGNSDSDRSGLELALDDISQAIPKVMVTGFPMVPEDVRAAFERDLDRSPAAIAFLSKQEGPEALLRAVRRGLAMASTFRQAIDELSGQLEADYGEARWQSRYNSRLALIFSTIATALILLGVIMSFRGLTPVAVVTATAGAVIEVVAFLFHRRVDVANRRMDAYHGELVQVRRFENLLVACTQLPRRRADQCHDFVIRLVASTWFQAPIRTEPADPPIRAGEQLE